MQTKAKKQLRALVFSALCLALGLIVKQFSIMVPILGVNGLRIGFSGIFTAIPAILFGPVYGAAVYGLSDVIGLILKPDGGWLPQLTLTAVIGGAMRGYLWQLLSNKTPLKNGFLKYLIMLFISGIIITTANTFILMHVFAIKKAFILFYTPRLAEEIIITVINAALLALIMPRIEKHIKLL